MGNFIAMDENLSSALGCLQAVAEATVQPLHIGKEISKNRCHDFFRSIQILFCVIICRPDNPAMPNWYIVVKGFLL